MLWTSQFRMHAACQQEHSSAINILQRNSAVKSHEIAAQASVCEQHCDNNAYPLCYALRVAGRRTVEDANAHGGARRAERQAQGRRRLEGQRRHSREGNSISYHSKANSGACEHHAIATRETTCPPGISYPFSLSRPIGAALKKIGGPFRLFCILLLRFFNTREVKRGRPRITKHDDRSFAVSCHPSRNSRPKPGSAYVFCEHVFERDHPRVYVLHAVARADAVEGLAGPSALRYVASAYQIRSKSLGDFKQRSAVDHGVRDRIRLSTRPSAGAGASPLQIRQE